MEKIISNDELNDLHKKGKGYIYNDYGTKKGNLLHKTRCYVCNPKYKKGMRVPPPKYYFNTIEKAKECLDKNRPNNYGFAGCCLKKYKIKQ